MAAGSLPIRLLGLFQAYPEVILSIACFLFLFYFRRRSYQIGQTNWPVIGMFPAIIIHFHHLHDFITHTLREAGWSFAFKGPWFLGMNMLITCDPANVNHILNVNFSNYPKGEDFAEIFDILGDGIFCADGESWRIQRKLAQVIMGNRGFKSFLARTTSEKAEKGLVPLLNHWAASGESVNLENLFMRVAFDITCISSFGVDPGCLAIHFPTIPFAKAIDDVWETLAFRHYVPRSCWKLVRWLGVWEERKLARGREVIDHFIAQQISKKREEYSRKEVGSTAAESDLLTSYINQQVDDVAPGMFEADKFLRDTVLTLMIAGRDGFGITLAWLFWLLSKNPQVEVKILDELKAHAPSPKGLDLEELGSMVYLHGAVCETLRLYPPVPFEHKGVLNSEVLPSGHRVEPGIKILFSMYAMGRMEGIWGKDCMEFRPERWISEKGKVRYVPAYKFLAFNSGPRSCLGKDIAFTLIKTVAANVIWNFEVEVLDANAVAKNSVFLRMKNGMRVTVRKRAP